VTDRAMMMNDFDESDHRAALGAAGDAGAWDYLSKPVDSEQMLSVLQAWLHR
jgi:CheY-like chemotaxis protein